MIAIEVGEFLRQFVANMQSARRNGPSGAGFAAGPHLYGERGGPDIAVSGVIGQDLQEPHGTQRPGIDIELARGVSIDYLDGRFRLVRGAAMRRQQASPGSEAVL